ncbi:MAG: IPT/TIG domain-containing protein [Candidatus Methylomirabilales bacterium]
MGNLLEIRRTNASDFPGPVAITFFDPDRGEVGTVVTIFGAGFSPVPADNQVTFNGTPAPVTASTDQTITTEVPAGATTGLIAVTTPRGSATSQEDFVVLVQVIITPPIATVFVGGSVQFTANTAVNWQVNNLPGGNATIGTISPGGLYQAPTTLPDPPELTVTAVSQADARFTAIAPVTILSVPERFAARDLSVQFAELPIQANPAQAPLVATAFAPFITSLSSNSGAVGGAPFTLTVNGEGFVGATDLQFVLNGTNDTNVTVSAVTPAADGRSLTATITIAGTATVGSRIVRVVTPAATSTIQPLGGNIFTVTP